MFPYDRPCINFNRLGSIVTRAVGERKHAKSGRLHVWIPVTSIYGVVSIEVCIRGTAPQLLWENSIRPNPLDSNIHWSFLSMVCSFASMTTIDPSPSVLHFPHWAATSPQNSYFGHSDILLLTVSLDLLVLCLQTFRFAIIYVASYLLPL